MDHDIGNNGLVLYSLQQFDARFFQVDSSTGVIKADQSLSAGRTYQLTVTATDKVSKR